jgi:hypothetical protein
VPWGPGDRERFRWCEVSRGTAREKRVSSHPVDLLTFGLHLSNHVNLIQRRTKTASKFQRIIIGPKVHEE